MSKTFGFCIRTRLAARAELLDNAPPVRPPRKPRNWLSSSSIIKTHVRGLLLLVGEEGVEPSRPKGHRILSPARLPVPPLAR